MPDRAPYVGAHCRRKYPQLSALAQNGDLAAVVKSEHLHLTPTALGRDNLTLSIGTMISMTVLDYPASSSIDPGMEVSFRVRLFDIDGSFTHAGAHLGSTKAQYN